MALEPVEEPTLTEAPVEEPLVTEAVVEFTESEPVVEEPVTEPLVEASIPEPTVETLVTESVVEASVPESIIEVSVTEPVAEAPAVTQSEEPLASVVESGKLNASAWKSSFFFFTEEIFLTPFLSSYTGIKKLSLHL